MQKILGRALILAISIFLILGTILVLDVDSVLAVQKTCPSHLIGEDIIQLPLVGPVDISQMSLPVLTVVLAGLDGLNPCAMWVLLFLIALLINTRSRKKMWLVGGTFILASGLVYYLLLAAWLNLFLFVSYQNLTRIIIGLLALVFGLWQLKKFFTWRPGVCPIAPTGSQWHQRLTERVKKLLQPATLPATLGGVIALAFGINLVESVCSAGLPACFTRILALNQLAPLTYYLYLLLYTFIFMLDDLIIFTIAIITLSKIGFTEKYNYWATLVGGLIVIILGLLLLFRPGILIF